LQKRVIPRKVQFSLLTVLEVDTISSSSLANCGSNIPVRVYRGDGREEIFHDDPDRERFLATLTEASGKTEWRVHAW